MNILKFHIYDRECANVPRLKTSLSPSKVLINFLNSTLFICTDFNAFQYKNTAFVFSAVDNEITLTVSKAPTNEFIEAIKTCLSDNLRTLPPSVPHPINTKLIEVINLDTNIKLISDHAVELIASLTKLHILSKSLEAVNPHCSEFEAVESNLRVLLHFSETLLTHFDELT